MEFPKKHLFICTNSPENPAKCGFKGSETLHKAVKEACLPLGKSVRVNKSGCLGQCERGIAAVMYPKGEWCLDLKSTDIDKLINLIQDK